MKEKDKRCRVYLDNIKEDEEEEDLFASLDLVLLSD